MRAEVDPSRCFSFAYCVEEAPEVFTLDETNTSVAGAVPEGAAEAVVLAAAACPVAAIRVWDDAGDEVDPR